MYTNGTWSEYSTVYGGWYNHKQEGKSPETPYLPRPEFRCLHYFHQVQKCCVNMVIKRLVKTDEKCRKNYILSNCKKLKFCE